MYHCSRVSLPDIEIQKGESQRLNIDLGGGASSQWTELC